MTTAALLSLAFLGGILGNIIATHWHMPKYPALGLYILAYSIGWFIGNIRLFGDKK